MGFREIKRLRQRIETTLARLEIPDADWTCVKAASVDPVDRPEGMHDGILVVWQTDRNTIAFYDESGRLLTDVGLDEKSTRSRAA